MNKRVARVIAPQKNAAFGFDEKIEFRANATEETKTGVVDISHLIQWRKPVRGMGPTFSMSFRNRKSAVVAIYLNGTWYDSVSLQIVCKAAEIQPPVSTDEKLLARIMMAEGMACSVEERRAIGYVVVNRLRFVPGYFGATMEKVVFKRGQFDGITNDVFSLLDSDSKIAKELDFEQCRRYRETIIMARQILGDPKSAMEALFIEEGKHAFYMNRATNYPPDGDKSPLIRSKTVSGMRHSFYTSTRGTAPK
ncbi:MAG: hypothetical protein WA705_12655 [Candidatus Ozemobacteraceae bacterium]